MIREHTTNNVEAWWSKCIYEDVLGFFKKRIEFLDFSAYLEPRMLSKLNSFIVGSTELPRYCTGHYDRMNSVILNNSEWIGTTTIIPMQYPKPYSI